MGKLLCVYHKLSPRLQNLALSIYGFFLRKQRYGKAFHQTLESLEDGKFDPFIDQENRLREILSVALQKNAHYRSLFKGQHLDLSKINIENFKSIFPVLEKSTIRKNPESFHSDGYSKMGTVDLNTSGTTGTPLTFRATKQSVKKNYAFFNNFLRSIGVDEFQRSATFAGRLIVPETNKIPPFWRKNYAMNTLLCSSYHLNNETIPDYIKALEEWQPLFIDSYPSAIYEVSLFINTNKLDHNINLKAIITSSETLRKQQRSAIERAFRCPVFDQYGCVEMAVMAYQQKDGRYFIPPQYSIVEVLDDYGAPVAPGETGHLVCTGLLNSAMPLIRYRVGDIVKTSKCQRSGYPYVLFIDQIEGRDDDVIISSSGTRIGRLASVFNEVSGIVEGQIVQKSLSLLNIKLVVSDEYAKAKEIKILGALKDRVGEEMEIDFEYVEQIQREKNGKLKFLKSEL